jgi:ribosomal protein L37E
MKTKDTYRIEGNVVVCISSSGKEYNLTSQECSCAGFGFRRTCRHYKEAKALGLFDKIEQQQKKLGLKTFSPQMIIERKKAIAQFMVKNGIESRQSIINAIEPYVNPKMTPEKFLTIVRKLLTKILV